MANDEEKKRRTLRQTIAETPGGVLRRSEVPLGARPRQPLPTHVRSVSQTGAPRDAATLRGEQQMQELEARTPLPSTPPVAGLGAPLREEAVVAGQVPPTPSAAAGVRASVGGFDPRTSMDPRYVEARELQETGPAGIRRGTVGKYAAGETPFTQEQFERARTIGQYEKGVPQLTPREMGARTQPVAAAPWDPSVGAPAPIGGATPTGIREYRPEEFVTHTGGRRILNVAALKAAGLNVQQIEAQQKRALEGAGLRQEADIAQATGLRAEKKLASEERRTRLAGVRATGKEATAERRHGETRAFETQKFMAGRTDQRVEEMATELQDGKTIVIPGRAQEIRGFLGRSGGARSEGELEHLTNMFAVGKAFQRAQGQAQNPLQSLRDAPIIGGLIRGLDERGTPQINEAQVRSALKSYDSKVGTYKIGKETVSEADLGLEPGMVASMLRGLLEKK